MMRHETSHLRREKASKPLLSQGRVKTGKYYLRTQPGPSPLDTEDGPIFMMKRKRNTSLIWFDVFITILEMLQILALVQVMSLRWVWPKIWINYTYFLFIFNVDIWELVKVSSGVFHGVQDYFTPSSFVPFSYNYIVLGWGLFLLCLIGGFVGTYAVLRYRKRPYLLVHVARMERAGIIIAQVIAIPLGVAIAKLFQCTNIFAKVDPLNDLTCFSGLHWAYVALAIFVIIGFYFLVPARMIYRTRQEILAGTPQHHETYLQLKEMEYMSGLDVLWIVKGFHIFSSFRLRSAYFRPFLHFFKFVLLSIYAAAVQNIFAQALATTGTLFVLLLAVTIIRPFRITSFNVFFVVGYLCLLGDCIMGSCLASVPPSEVLSPWLVEPYSTWILVGVNGVLLLSMLAFLGHLLVYNLYWHRRKGHSPLWPDMANHGADKVGVETKKYMVSVLKARSILEKCRSANPMFAPVHELSQHIQVINAYFREAEKLGDGLHDTLWDLLDEMIQVHEKLEPKSLFGDGVKDSIRETAAELMKLMPMFTRRLAQRDYDLILVSPLKRRMLLKMTVLSFFLNGRSRGVAKKQITGPEMTRIWPESETNPRVEDTMEYYEDLMPAPPQGPDQEQMYLSESLCFPLQLVDIDEDEKSVSSILKGAPEIQLLSPPPSRPSSSLSCHSRVTLRGEDNKGFEGDSGGQTDTVVDLEDYSPGETTTDGLIQLHTSKQDSGEDTQDTSPTKASGITISNDHDKASQEREIVDQKGHLKRTLSSTHITGAESEDNTNTTSQSLLQPVSTSSPVVTTSSEQQLPVKEKKMRKKKKSSRKKSNTEDPGDSTDY
ncbi:LOW QUALITY PROTEIN: uncharacterized protein LOC124270288 [Haliotis rubra]|uniref:LOW QUALITY PROTEIN: uncharacterized protein LOC124270288 n=1 Tax=Haliotis rubra TaxID=36100 RepID=UPI001EE52E6A|nr:LOW QUALITY PROTEIN: uncharacterized protein LOC124270288 [Haliotis rubra]